MTELDIPEQDWSLVKRMARDLGADKYRVSYVGIADNPHRVTMLCHLCGLRQALSEQSEPSTWISHSVDLLPRLRPSILRQKNYKSGGMMEDLEQSAFDDMWFRRQKSEIAQLRGRVAQMEARIAYYEEPVPVGRKGCFHKFNDDGLCIRCGEDAEEWEAGCVEEIVEDLKSVVHPEFVDALDRIVRHRYTHEHRDIAREYLGRIKKLSAQFNWEESDAEVGVDRAGDSGDDDFILTL